MRILDLEIKNLGLHKHLQASLGGAIVGLLGANGCGKSTALTIIQFLLTGHLPDKQESYVRKVDPAVEKQVKSGFARMNFLVDGNIGSLYRRVGTSPARELTWDGNTYTKSEEIKDVLQDILGADAYAIDNATFPRQGQLDKILFGTQAEREELLIKLLLVGYMQRVADISAGKATSMGKEIQDYSVLSDELTTQHREAELILGKLRSAIQNEESYEEAVDNCEELKNLQKTLEQKGNALRAARANMESLQSSIGSLLASLSKAIGVSVSTYQDYKDKLSDLRETITTKQEEYEYQTTCCAAATRKNELEVRKEEVDKALLKQDSGSEDFLNHLIAKKDSVSKRLEALQEKLAIKKDMDRISEQLVENASKQEELRHKENSLSLDVAKTEKQVESLKLPINIIQPLIEVGRSVCELNEEKNCPLCGSNVELSRVRKNYEDAKNRLPVLEAKLSETQQELAEHKQELNSTQDNLSRLLNTADLLTSNYQTKYNKLQAFAAEPDGEQELQDSLDNIDNKISNEERKIGAAAHLENEKEKIKAAINAFSEDDKKNANQANPELKDKLKKSLDDLKNSLEDLLSYEKRLVSAYDQLTSESGTLKQLKKEIEDGEEELGRLISSFKDPFLSMFVRNNNQWTPELQEEVDNKREEYLEKAGRVKQAKLTADNYKERLSKIEEKIAADEIRRSIVEDLRKLTSAFSRGGIPMAYVQHRYKELVERTQDTLDFLEADFVIQPHPSKPVTLQFSRVSQSGGVVLDQEKLSGGQKVRLSIAFLLAVQELIIPDLGLLVLDEPSTHLDTEGKESLRDLLIELGRLLGNSETQIFVCDHAMELEPAFDQVIKL